MALHLMNFSILFANHVIIFGRSIQINIFSYNHKAPYMTDKLLVCSTKFTATKQSRVRVVSKTTVSHSNAGILGINSYHGLFWF